MSLVMVTGARGFIGRQTVGPFVARNFEVVGVTSRPPPDPVDGVRWEQADLLDVDAVEKLVDRVRPSHLLHLAWFAKPGEYASSPLNLDWLRASLHLLQCFADSGGERFVGAGTCFEYDWEYGYCREGHTPPAPSTLYGACKHALNTALSAFARQRGLSSAWGRVFFLYGPHEAPSRLVSSVVRALLEGRDAPCSSGTQLRDFLHVADVAEAFVHILDGSVTGPVNIASGDPVPVWDVVAGIAENIGRPDLVQRGALPQRKGEPHLLVADVTRLREEVGFQPRFGLRDGLSNTIHWWRERLEDIGADGAATSSVPSGER
jgi:nucleoside-diphosphate-sugar epimerase